MAIVRRGRTLGAPGLKTHVGSIPRDARVCVPYKKLPRKDMRGTNAEKPPLPLAVVGFGL